MHACGYHLKGFGASNPFSYKKFKFVKGRMNCVPLVQITCYAGGIFPLCEPFSLLSIADGRAFGPEMPYLVSLRRFRATKLFLPESFEWFVLRLGAVLRC